MLKFIEKFMRICSIEFVVEFECEIVGGRTKKRQRKSKMFAELHCSQHKSEWIEICVCELSYLCCVWWNKEKKGEKEFFSEQSEVRMCKWKSLIVLSSEKQKRER